MTIRSRDDLINYCFHQLGAPVIQVELEEQQVSYCVDNAIERWQTVHGDASVRRFIPHTVTAEDISRGYIIVPDKILNIVRVVPINYGGGTSTDISSMGIFNPIYQYHLNDFWDIARGGGVSVYNDVMTNLQMIQDVLQAEIGIAFNRYSSRLYLEVNWKSSAGQIKEGSIIVVECFVILDEKEAPKMYGDWWLKRYCTALMKKQWGTNTKKFNGVQLPGGITMNGQQIYDEALQEIAQLEHELKDEFELPPIFFVG